MNPNDPVAADPVVSPVDPPAWDYADVLDGPLYVAREPRDDDRAAIKSGYFTILTAGDYFDGGGPIVDRLEWLCQIVNERAALLAVGERDKAEIDGLVDEVRRLADRAVCSGCGSDVGESGICTYSDCDDGEMIPASDMPWALRKRCDDIQEERAEWRSDWEALRAEAKALEVAGERDRRQIARLTEAAADVLAYNGNHPSAKALSRLRAVLADEEDAGDE